MALKDLFEQIEREFKPQVDAIGGTFVIEKNLPSVIGDPALLNLVFSNLVDNAISYRKTNVPLHVEITARREFVHVVVCVHDNGIGIDPAYHEKIFEVFQRLNPDHMPPGTGIGLAKVKKSIETLAGRIRVESSPAHGSTFCVQLKGA